MNTLFTPVKSLKLLIIAVVVIVSLIGFGFYMYQNMGKKSKASGSGTVTVNLSSTVSGQDIPVYTVGVSLQTNNNNKMSAIDLYFENPDDSLDFMLPVETPVFALESPDAAAFNETVRLAYTNRIDNSKKLSQITMVAKAGESSLKSTAMIRLRFKRKPGTTGTSAVLRLSKALSTVTGPDIANNIFELTPADPTVSFTFTDRPTSTPGPTSTPRPTLARKPPTSTPPPQPTATPPPAIVEDKAKLMFKVLVPDVAGTIPVLGNVRVQLRDGGNPLDDTRTTLQRIPGTQYFKTLSPLEFEVAGGKAYTIQVKQLKTIRRSFTVTLRKGSIVDCVKDVPDTDCGSLKSPNLAPLFSGDSDGYNDGSNGSTRSDSFNKIDVADLQRIIVGYNTSPIPVEPNADFNLDGKIDIFDLGILGKNFRKSGE